MKYPEAIEHYEEVLLEDPHDMEAISSLIKIYGIGWKKGEKNLERAFELLERVDDERLASNLINSISFELEADEILGSEEKIMDMIAILEKYNEDDAHYARFKYHRAKGNYREARDSLENLENFLPDTLVFLHIYFGDYDLAVERLLDERFYPSRLQGETFRSAILGLGENPPPADEMEALREFLLEMINGGAYEQKDQIYKRLVNNVDNQDILTIVDEIYNQRHWNY
jgi:tetratricopeptide (TPR) repeat protein